MSNPTGRTGKRLVEKTATGTRVFYRTADGRPSRTLDITPKGSKYFATATKREIEQAGGKVVRKRAGRKPADKTGRYKAILKTYKGTTVVGYATTQEGAKKIALDAMRKLPKNECLTAEYRIRKA